MYMNLTRNLTMEMPSSCPRTVTAKLQMDLWNIQEVSSRGFASVDISLFPPFSTWVRLHPTTKTPDLLRVLQKLTSPHDSFVTNGRSLGLVKDRGKTPLLRAFQATVPACFWAFESEPCCCDLEKTLPWYTKNNRWRKVGWLFDNSPQSTLQSSLYRTIKFTL